MKLKSTQKYFFFLILTIFSCRENSTIRRPDVSNIDIDVRIERFDTEISNIKVDDIPSYNVKWTSKYGAFYNDFLFTMLGVGRPQDTITVNSILPQVLQKAEFKDLSAAVQKKYPNMDRQEKELVEAFKYLKYYYPEFKVPRVITFFSGFAYQIPIGEDYVGIGLDMFLGADSEFYPALVQSIPLYMSRRFTPENITPRVVEALLREEFYPIPDNTRSTLQHMLYNGKVLYALDVILGESSDELKIGYTKEQLLWAKKYESDVWTWFMQENLLYSTDQMRIQKYFTEAPFTPELGENNESAPKLGNYIGWMIVRKFMDKNPTLDLKDLFAIDDAQSILEGSKYKGK